MISSWIFSLAGSLIFPILIGCNGQTQNKINGSEANVRHSDGIGWGFHDCLSDAFEHFFSDLIEPGRVRKIANTKRKTRGRILKLGRP